MSIISSFFKNSELGNIRKKFILLYILNVADVIFTLFLLSTGRFIEINLFMAPIVNNNQMLSLYIKTVIPLLLFMWIFYRMRKASGRQLFQANSIINGCMVFYGLINISHVIWCICVYYFN